MVDDNMPAPIIENLAELISKRQGLFKGTLKIFLVHAFNLVKSDGDASDPYVVF